MTRDELISLLAGDRCKEFVGKTASAVVEADAVGLLYALATEPCMGLPASERHRLLVRSAWTLERICLGAHERFEPFADRFCRVDFHACSDPGVRRHFGKIMADFLSRSCPVPEILDAIAGTAAGWAVDPAAKTAVRVWAVETLKACRTQVPWAADSWDDFVEVQARASSPGIRARLRNSWKAE